MEPVTISENEYASAFANALVDAALARDAMLLVRPECSRFFEAMGAEVEAQAIRTWRPPVTELGVACEAAWAVDRIFRDVFPSRF